MSGLLAVAGHLASASEGAEPGQREAFRRRAVSTAYYAAFDALAAAGADLLVGPGTGRSGTDWVRVYRALDHRAAKAACDRAKRAGDAAPRPSDALRLFAEASAALANLAAMPDAERRRLALDALFKDRP